MPEASHPIFRSPWWAVAAASLLSLAVYWPSLGYEFVYDDKSIVGADERLDDPAFGYKLWVASWWPEGSLAPASRPLTTFTFWLQVQLHGRQEAAFHLVNVALFAILSGAVAWLTWRWLGSLAAAWAVGILFAVHPIHVEVAANIVGRAEILSGLFMVLAVGLYLKWRPVARTALTSRDSTSRDREGAVLSDTASRQPLPDGRGSSNSPGFTWRRASLIGLMILLAGLSKEHGYLVAPMLGLIELAQRRMERAPLLRGRAIPWKVVGVIAAVAVIAVVQREAMLASVDARPGVVNELDNPLPHATPHERVVTPFKLVGKAAVLLAAPMEQSPDYSPRVLMPTIHLDEPLVLLGIAVIVAWIAATVLAWRNRHIALGPLLTLPVAWFIPSNTLLLIGTIFGERLLTTLSIFLPIALAAMVLNVKIPRRAGMMVLLAAVGLGAAYIGNVFGSFMPYAERGMLAPAWQVAVVGVVIAAAVAAYVMHRRLRVSPWLAAALFIVSFAYGTANVLYSGFWKDGITLNQTTVLRHPMTGRFQAFLAQTLFQRGVSNPQVRAEFYAAAEQAAWKALEYWPRQARPYVVLAAIAVERGDQEKGWQYARYAERFSGRDDFTLGVLAQLGARDEAKLKAQIEDLEKAVAANPADHAARLEIAELKLRLIDPEQTQEALAIYKQLDNPPRSDARFLKSYANALFTAADVPGAMAVYRRWIAAAPNDHVALTDGAFVALMLNDPEGEALAWIRRAMQISPGSSEPWAALAEYHRLHEDADKAIAAYQEAIRRTTEDDPKRVHYQLMIDKLRAG